MKALDDILAQIRAAEAQANRPAGAARLIAVSKTNPAERIAPVLEAGHRLFGENRVQEAAEKWPGLRTRFGGVELHLIGPLQTNKVKAAFDLFDVIQTLDRDSLAVKIAREAQAQGRCPALFIQVNTGEEPQKAGVAPGEADAFIARCRDELGLPISGLMAIPPVEADPSPHFAMLAQIAARNGLSALSMGMSADFPVAIAHGATFVRVGSALFGARISPQ